MKTYDRHGSVANNLDTVGSNAANSLEKDIIVSTENKTPDTMMMSSFFQDLRTSLYIMFHNSVPRTEPYRRPETMDSLSPLNFSYQSLLNSCEQ